ncbi:MAG: hypothetical protein U1E20_13745 [Methylocystis sp.]|uniref:hypothetical protein n=1 Tax=Methylocystis sp. TaxID=1911079 RepID=UPI00395A89C4
MLKGDSLLLAAALSILSGALANGSIANAAAQNVTPLPSDECSAIARTIGDVVGIALKTTVGTPDLPDLHGTACLMSGSATGLTMEFDNARKKLEASLLRAAWTAVIDFDADGPASTQKGFAKASQRVVYALSTEPPHRACANVPIVDCKVPRRRWVWTLKLTAFVK